MSTGKSAFEIVYGTHPWGILELRDLSLHEKKECTRRVICRVLDEGVAWASEEDIAKPSGKV